MGNGGWRAIAALSLSLALASTALIVLFIVIDVTGRHVFNRAFFDTIQAIELMMAFLVFFSITYGSIVGMHVRASFLLDRMRHTPRQLAELFSALLGLLLFSAVAWGAWPFFWDSWVIGEVIYGSVYLPYWAAKLGMFMAALATFVVFLKMAFSILIGARTRK